MADADNSAEKAYAAAAAEATSKDKAPESKPVESEPAAKKPEVTTKVEAETAPASKPAPAVKAAAPVKKSAPAKKAIVKKTSAKPAARKSAVRVAKPVAAKPVATAPQKAAPPKHTVTELKEKIMATAKTDITASMTEAMKEMQSKAKAAYDKGTEMATEMGDFTKGNVEALVESGKIFSTGVQDLSKSYVEDAKSAYETLTADMKEMAAVKSPTELFQLQGKIMRRNFDSLVSTGSKSSETFMKLANDTFAPLSGRMTVAADKMSKVA